MASSSSNQIEGFTGFRYINQPSAEAELRVIAAGYPWASTSKLRQPGRLPRHGEHIHFDYLGIHAHSGDNTHLIINGKIVIRQHPVCNPPDTLLTLPSGLNKSRYVELSLDLKATKELPIGPGEIYEGTTECGAEFVEGHRCLSPTTAARFMERGYIYWVENGHPVAGHLQEVIMQALDCPGFAFKWTRGGPFMPGDATMVDFPPHRGLPEATRQRLCDWFKAEWDHHDVPTDRNDRPYRKLVDIAGLYPPPRASWFGGQR